MIESLQELIAIPSIAENGEPGRPYGKAAKDALDYALSLCGRLGFRTKACADLTGWAEIGSGEEMIGILVHLDVVPPGDGWTHPPFGAVIEDNKLYGRGSIDDKGPAVACIYAMKDLLDEGVAFDRRVRIIFGQAEESGSWEDIEHYKKTEEIPVCGFTPDSGFPAIYGEKGIVFYKFSMPYGRAGIKEIKGGNAVNMVADHCKATLRDKEGNELDLERKGVSAHGSRPELGENAITKLMGAIYSLQLEGKVDCPFAGFYQDTIADCIHGEKINCELEDKESGKLTFNVGAITSDEKEISMAVDVRFPVTFTKEEVTARLASAVEPYGVTVSAEEYTRPVYMDKDGPVIKMLLEAYRSVTGDNSEPFVIGGGTYARAMDNIIAFGPLLPGRKSLEHQPDENISLDDLATVRNIYREAIRRLAVKTEM